VGGAVLAGKNYAVNLPATAATSGIGLALGTVGNLAVLNARLSAAESNGQAKTVSMPKIMTLDNKAAKITQGYQVPYTIYNLSTVQTQFVNAALQLDVIPHVTSDGAVQMSVKISQNAPDFEKRDNLGIPAILTKEATTELLVRDGDTAVIGGIYTRKAFNGSNQVPLLGSIPILGWLFKSTNKVDEQSEMLVFLTPRLMNRKKSTIDASLVDKKTGLVN
jgi:type IV pilus assembly protein PilQ